MINTEYNDSESDYDMVMFMQRRGKEFSTEFFFSSNIEVWGCMWHIVIAPVDLHTQSQDGNMKVAGNVETRRGKNEYSMMKHNSLKLIPHSMAI